MLRKTIRYQAIRGLQPNAEAKGSFHGYEWKDSKSQLCFNTMVVVRCVLFVLTLLLAHTWSSAIDYTSFTNGELFPEEFQLLVDAASQVSEDEFGGHVMSEIIDAGFTPESHQVTTSDGYILTVFRIPPKPHHSLRGYVARGVVLLQHGLVDSAYTWVMNNATGCLPYMLANAGYDVWLGNIRGNQYGRGHTSLKDTDTEFWDFTFVEHAYKDLPAIIDYALQVSKAKTLTMVGHSQGSAMALLAASNTTVSAKLNQIVALAPAVFIDHSQVTILHLMAKMRIADILAWFNKGEFKLSASILKKLPGLCEWKPSLCENVMCAVSGCPPANNLQLDRFLKLFREYPAPTSIKNILLWSEMNRAGTFRQFDYGKEGNLVNYGTVTPPELDISHSNVPTVVFNGLLDRLADAEDMPRMLALLSPHTVHVEMPNYGHGDFVWGADAHVQLYPAVMDIIDKATQTKAL
eukprot:GILK01007184.1.p1 GENE.GILK01007184.1~~GILK01007184.1.p1  ORF type:complete len:463 (-),score=53.58 GILK01007184.1:202-1590(-)